MAGMDKLTPSASTECLRGALHILPIGLGALPFAILLGGSAIKAGFSPLEVALMSATIFAGSSQFIAVQLWDAGASAAAVVMAVLLVNLRHLLLGAALGPVMGRYSLGTMAPAVFFMADEVWAISMRRGSTLSLAYWYGVGGCLYLIWLAASVAGAFVGALIDDPSRWGLDFAFVAIFACLMAGYIRGRGSVLPLIVSGLVAVLVKGLMPEGSLHILAGGLTGAAVSLLPSKRDDGGRHA